jgi:hypothetical protein
MQNASKSTSPEMDLSNFNKKWIEKEGPNILKF